MVYQENTRYFEDGCVVLFLRTVGSNIWQYRLRIPGITNRYLRRSSRTSNFEKARYGDDHSDSDIAASLSNMVGEIIGTVSYLNALLMGVSEVFFIGRVGNLEVVRSGITDRLALANIKGNFDSQSGFGNALGVMFFLNKES